MKKIPLTKGMSAMVDDADYEWLNQWKWNVNKAGRRHYAARRHGIKEGGNGEVITMHRVIMNNPAGMDIDHIDGDGLNNQRSNLRICTHAENVRNRKKPIVNNEKYIGVKTYKGIFKTSYRAIIGHNGKVYHLGMFPTAEDAAMAYDKKARELFGEFANTNF